MNKTQQNYFKIKLDVIISFDVEIVLHHNPEKIINKLLQVMRHYLTLMQLFYSDGWLNFL